MMTRANDDAAEAIHRDPGRKTTTPVEDAAAALESARDFLCDIAGSKEVASRRARHRDLLNDINIALLRLGHQAKPSGRSPEGKPKRNSV